MSTTTLRPTGDGMYQEFSPFPAAPSTQYDKVNEEVPDEDATYIESTALAEKTSTFTKDTIPSGLPLRVTVRIRAKSLSGGVENNSAACLITAGGRYSQYLGIGPSYGDNTKTWFTNPATGAPWTLAEVNDLEFGIYQDSLSDGIRVTQAWLEVFLADNTVAVADTGAGEEAVGIESNASVTDTGGGSDALGLETSISPSDTGSGSDALSLSASLTVADAGTNQQEAVGMGAVYDPRFERTTMAAAITVPDTGVGVDAIASLLASMTVADTGAGADAAVVNASMVVLDTGGGNDGVLLVASIPVADTGAGIDAIASLTASVTVADTGAGVDATTVAKAYFYIDHNGYVYPLGVLIMNDSRQDLLPGTRENTETVPGKHGEIDFGSELQPRILELHVASGVTPSDRERVKRTLAKWLNPILGVQNLIFEDDIDKTYRVKYAGKIDIQSFANWLEFTIPLKAGDPFIIGTWEKTQTGSGTLNNEGTFETPLTIEIAGPVVDPSVVVGSDTLTWTSSLDAGDTLVIDTENRTVKLNGSNALGTYSGEFPKLQPGDTAVTAAAAGATTWKWRDRWI